MRTHLPASLRLRRAWRIVLPIPLLAGLLTGNLGAATVQFSAVSLGSDVFRYDYVVSGIVFQAYQELDIRFDPALYSTLSDGVAGADFDVLLTQPNNPTGTFGDYSAMALINGPSLATPFSVTVLFLGAGTPGAQPYFINQLSQDNGQILSTIVSGRTTSAVPEPAGWSLCGLGLIVCGIAWLVRHRLWRIAPQ